MVSTSFNISVCDKNKCDALKIQSFVFGKKTWLNGKLNLQIYTGNIINFYFSLIPTSWMENTWKIKMTILKNVNPTCVKLALCFYNVISMFIKRVFLNSIVLISENTYPIKN